MRKVFAVVAAVAVVVLAAPAYAEVVHSLPEGGWRVLPDTTAGATATVVDGPGSPPAGTGSLRLTVETLADRALVGTSAAAGVFHSWQRLSGRYSTYIQPGSPEFSVPSLRLPGYQQ